MKHQSSIRKFASAPMSLRSREKWVQLDDERPIWEHSLKTSAGRRRVVLIGVIVRKISLRRAHIATGHCGSFRTRDERNNGTELQ